MRPSRNPARDSAGWRRRSLALLTASSIVLSGCTQVQQMTGSQNCDDPALSPSRQLLCKDNATFNNTIAGNALMGGVLGAMTGAATCVAAGKSNVLTCSAIGLGIGLFAGGVGGYLTAKKEQAGKENVREIDAVTDDIRDDNIALSQRVTAGQETVDEDQAALASIRSQVQAGTLAADQAAAKRASIAADSANLAAIIKHEQEQEQNFTKAGQQLTQSTPSYERQLNDLHGQIASLTAQKDALDQAMSASS